MDDRKKGYFLKGSCFDENGVSSTFAPDCGIALFYENSQPQKSVQIKQAELKEFRYRKANLYNIFKPVLNNICVH
ncbi:hypothetical protein J416_01474 [Gracilibacillus halophilus YIM-C55.5]|uniref:Uncharacterized protein n=1 Tax=Gracilibacillus halophilus YIM-C55.5 TaxID=1308866 RepID=N4WPU2_9BACI|nr:hypothetical protein J416_01474 [Gracilibacillus halophilus YIM-C55.5]